MVTRILVGVILGPAFLAALVALPASGLTVLVSGIAAIASYELLRAVGAGERKVVCVLTAAAAALVPVCYWRGIDQWGVTLILVTLMCALFMIAIFTYEKAGALRAETVLFCLFGGVAIPSFLSALLRLRMMEQGQFLVLLPVVAAFLTDIGAYFFGVFFGRHRGITKVSPNKSAEGFVGGLVSGMVFMLGYALVLRHGFGVEANMLRMAVYGLLGSLVTMLGDLSFSLIKRQFGIKDYGSLLPGHGGMLDRFDSLIFAAPALWALVTVFPAI